MLRTVIIALALLVGAATADTSVAASGNAAAFASDMTNSSFVKTGRRSLAQDPSLATAATGGGVAFAGGDGKWIGSSGASGPCKNTATSGPNSFAWAGPAGGPSAPFMISWGPRGAGQAAPAPLEVCPNTVVHFVWDGASPPRGVTQVSGPSCPAKFGDGEKGQRVIAPPATSGKVGVRASKADSTLYFADPGNCAATLTTIRVLKP